MMSEMRFLTLTLLVAACQAPVPLMCDAVEVRVSGDDCVVQWGECNDDATREVDCVREGAQHRCDCVEDEALVTSFFDDDFCGRVVGDDAEVVRLETNDACPWDIGTPYE